jgi:hypothetical protein
MYHLNHLQKTFQGQYLCCLGMELFKEVPLEDWWRFLYLSIHLMVLCCTITKVWLGDQLKMHHYSRPQCDQCYSVDCPVSRGALELKDDLFQSCHHQNYFSFHLRPTYNYVHKCLLTYGYTSVDTAHLYEVEFSSQRHFHLLPLHQSGTWRSWSGSRPRYLSHHI